jgi:hypothetical protein
MGINGGREYLIAKFARNENLHEILYSFVAIH